MNTHNPSIKSKLKVVFALYLCTVLFYGVVYYLVYSLSPNSFAFNGDIRRQALSMTALDVMNSLRNDVLPRMRSVRLDTLRAPDGSIVQIDIHKFGAHLYIIGNDTIAVVDSTKFPEVARRITEAYERAGVYEIWNLLDFIYFSTITVSTVGYGDILPNSTTVRMIVVSQIILGQIILIYLLNSVIISIGVKKDAG